VAGLVEALRERRRGATWWHRHARSLSARDGTLKNSNTVCLNARPARGPGARLGLRVLLENDCHCFALAEAHAVQGQGHAMVFG